MWSLLVALTVASEPEPEPTEPVEPQDSAPEPEPEAEPEVFVIEVDDESLGSALDDFADKAARIELEGEGELDDWLALNRGVLFRSRWFAKPQLSWATLQGGSGLRLGAAVGHQWFPMANNPLQVAGETRLAFAAPVGRTKGRNLELSSVLGPWLGPVGVRVGPILRWDRWSNDAAELDDALALGVRATAGIDARYVLPWVGVEPVWLLAGDREPWGAIGELSLLGGIAFATKWVQLGAQTTYRQTSLGPWMDFALTAQVRPR